MWEDERNWAKRPFVNPVSTSNFDIYGYNLSSKKEFQITTNVYWQGNPAIYGDAVVWKDTRSSGTTISDYYGCYLSTGEEFVLCGASGNPAIYENLVVFDRGYDIYGHYLPSPTTISPTPSQTPTQIPTVTLTLTPTPTPSPSPTSSTPFPTPSLFSLISYGAVVLAVITVASMLTLRQRRSSRTIPTSPVAERYCPFCNKEVKPDDFFCSYCGRELEKEKREETKAPVTVRCPLCKNEIDDNWIACPHCGTKLKDDTRVY